MYWLLNARRQGGEAAEWSLLDFQQRPSERLREASAIARVVNANAEVFAAARPVPPRVSVILSLDTMTLQDNYKWNDLPGRRRLAHLLSALGAYQALAELGVPTAVELVHDYDWEGASAAPRIVILPHLTAVSADEARRFETFVRNGNTLLVTGLTGLFDPQANAWPLGRSPLDNVLGARLKEIRLIGETGRLKLDTPALELPFHLWQGEIEPLGAGVIGRDGERVVATRHALGKGEAIWIPSLVALASWLGEREPFTKLLAGVTQPVRDELAATAVTFAERQSGTVLRTMQRRAPASRDRHERRGDGEDGAALDEPEGAASRDLRRSGGADRRRRPARRWRSRRAAPSCCSGSKTAGRPSERLCPAVSGTWRARAHRDAACDGYG